MAYITSFTSLLWPSIFEAVKKVKSGRFEEFDERLANSYRRHRRLIFGPQREEGVGDGASTASDDGD